MGMDMSTHIMHIIAILAETIEYEEYFISELQMRINIYKYLEKTTEIYLAGEIMKWLKI